MKLQFFSTNWGLEHMTYTAFIEKARDAGYDGVEIKIPDRPEIKDEIRAAILKYDMLLIAQHVEAKFESLFPGHIKKFESHLLHLAEMNPIFINSQSGKDYFTFEENSKIIERAFEIEGKTGVSIVHEIHRGKFTFAPVLIGKYLEAWPQLKLAADFSHWVNVSESTMQDPVQAQIIDRVAKHTKHMHARIGFEEGPQVNDPRAPEWKYIVDIHLNWWLKLAKQAKREGRETFTITPEFGPYPYMPQLPFTKVPVTNQWEVNLHMMNLLREFLTNNLNLQTAELNHL